jgi:hypothetical protein
MNHAGANSGRSHQLAAILEDEVEKQAEPLESREVL